MLESNYDSYIQQIMIEAALQCAVVPRSPAPTPRPVFRRVLEGFSKLVITIWLHAAIFDEQTVDTLERFFAVDSRGTVCRRLRSTRFERDLYVRAYGEANDTDDLLSLIQRRDAPAEEVINYTVLVKSSLYPTNTVRVVLPSSNKSYNAI